jgi:hypothetical protein
MTGPEPGNTFTTPSGTPASTQIWPSARAVSGVCFAGLSTMAQPAASAGATFQPAITKGKFHGTIWPATPTGSRKVRSMPVLKTGGISPASMRAAPA